MKSFLIIGGSSGIGLELVKLLSEQGHRVFASYNNTQPDAIEGVSYFPFDVTNSEAQFPELPEQINGLAYCPGAIKLLPFKRLKKDNLIADLDLQVLGAVRCIQEVLPKMQHIKGASVVMFSTVAVQSGFNFHSQVAISKGAIEGLTRSLAAEMAPTIRVNAVAPSITNTPLAERLLNSPEKIEANANRHPLKMVGDPKDVAQTAAFLLTDQSRWITGQVLTVDGGISTLKV